MTTPITTGPPTEASPALAAAQGELRDRRRQLAQDSVGGAVDEVVTADRLAVLAAERAVTAARQQEATAGAGPGAARGAGACDATVIATSLTAAIASTTAQRIALAHAQPAMAAAHRDPAHAVDPASASGSAPSPGGDGR